MFLNLQSTQSFVRLTVLCSLAAACSSKASSSDKSSEAKGSSSPAGSSSASAASKELTAKIEGRDLIIKSVMIRQTGDVKTLVFATDPKTDCKGGLPAKDNYEIEMYLDAGPGKKYFAGTEVPRAAGLVVGGETPIFDERILAAAGTTLKIDSGDLKEGNKITGFIDMDHKQLNASNPAAPKIQEYHMTGKFEATVCPNPYADSPSTEPTLPEKATEPFKGKIGGVALAGKTALATVMMNTATKREQLQEIRIFDDANVTCANKEDMRLKVANFAFFQLGITAKNKLVGHPLPATANYWTPKLSISKNGGSAWIQLDAVDFSQGGKVKGSGAFKTATDASKEDEGEASGTFEAIVCVEVGIPGY